MENTMKRTIGITAMLLMAFIVSGSLLAADSSSSDTDISAIKQATDQCVTAISNGRSEEGFGGLFKSYWYKPQEVDTTSRSMKGQYEGAEAAAELKIGKRLPNSFEFLGVRRLGKVAVKFVYAEKYEDNFIPWVFYFYRAGNDWKLNGIGFGDQPQVQEDLRAIWLSEAAQ
jgi:hypothetical protein